PAELFGFVQALPPVLLGRACSDERRREVVKGSFARRKDGRLPRRVRRTLPTQPWEQASLHDRRLSASRRADDGDQLQLFVARFPQQLLGEALAPEEELLVLFAEGLQRAVRAHFHRGLGQSRGRFAAHGALQLVNRSRVVHSTTEINPRV